jgi:methylthioribose-1-phosphate isomerase
LPNIPQTEFRTVLVQDDIPDSEIAKYLTDGPSSSNPRIIPIPTGRAGRFESAMQLGNRAARFRRRTEGPMAPATDVSASDNLERVLADIRRDPDGTRRRMADLLHDRRLWTGVGTGARLRSSDAGRRVRPRSFRSPRKRECETGNARSYMKVHGTPTRTIWVEDEPRAGRPGRVGIIDQTRLPHEYVTIPLVTLDDAAHAIADMLVRGAPLIGVTAAYGVALALHDHASDARLAAICEQLSATRPTAINLRWALNEMMRTVRPLPEADRESAAWCRAAEICDEDVEINRMIGVHGLDLIREIAARKPGPVNILTHCNAGWLATVDWGTATSPIYQAHDLGIPVHVWVDETRPRNQGAALTAWELANHGLPHHLVVDNTGGHLMQRGLVDLVITGTDRTTAAGDVCNKIGTYLKALAAADNGVPFFAALPSPTIDFHLERGSDIPIEERSQDEVNWVHGKDPDGRMTKVRIAPETSPAANFAFDVTPARLVSGLITEKGIVAADRAAIAAFFPDRAAAA